VVIRTPDQRLRVFISSTMGELATERQAVGQVNAGMEVSGLEEEFLLSRTEGQPRLLYVKMPAPDRDPRLTELLARISQEASYRRFSTAAELVAWFVMTWRRC
jgi:hypothetical protein